MAFIAVYDSCVLYPNTQRDLLVRLAMPGIIQAKWTERILDEVDSALVKTRTIPAEKLARRRQLMNLAVRDCLVINYESLIEGLKLPDQDDRHVLAAAVKAGAQVIVTNNLKDFPVEYLADWGIEPKSPDEFVMDLIDMHDRVVYACAGDRG